MTVLRFFIFLGVWTVLVLSARARVEPDPAATPAATPAISPEPAPPGPNAALKLEQEKLQLQTSIVELHNKAELAGIAHETARLEAESKLALQKLQKEIAATQAGIERLAKESALREAEAKAGLDRELSAARQELERLKLANETAAVQAAGRLRELEEKDKDVQLKQKQLALEQAEFQLGVARVSAEIDLWDKRDKWKDRVNREIEYTKEPFQNGILTISDRRIALNGPISMETADFVQERIDYFNNQSREFPVFLVIDRSPGGSVMAGYKILKAMRGSSAPVYVVVKSFAASMAAAIATLAEKSFAYPNAIFLHHQILSGTFGNLTEQKENLRDLEDWWRRLATPVAEKMGITLDEFIQRMYENRSTGNWQEFADRARKLNWVDHVVETIREESYVQNPDSSGTAPKERPRTVSAEQRDANGRPYVLLPRLEPVDCYYLYNPDGYYRLRP